MPASEPACSRFDYEEKLLAKAIRLEVTVEDLVKSVTNVQTDQAASEALTIKMKEIEARLDALESKEHGAEEKPGMYCRLNYFRKLNKNSQ